MNSEDIPRDGTWVSFITHEQVVHVLQYDSTAFGGKGCWFNKKGHAAKLPYPVLSWSIYKDGELQPSEAS